MENLLHRLTVRHLRLIRGISESGQLSVAAQTLTMTQPAASRSLGDIERLIGHPLFLRHPSGMTPTPVGDVLIRHAVSLLEQFERAIEEVDSFRKGLSGTVHIGAVTGSAVRFVVPAIQTLKSESHSASISVEVAPSVDLLEGLKNGRYDIVLCRVPPEGLGDDIDIQRGRVEVLRMVTRAGHPLQSQRSVTFRQLQDLTWVVQGTGMPIRDTVSRAFSSRSLRPPQDTVDTASLLVALSYIETSDAVAAITEEVANLVATDGERWSALPVRDEIVMSPYDLLARRRALMNPLCARLHGLLQDELSADGQRHSAPRTRAFKP